MVGKTLGQYEILEPLGAGGMGEVYRAHDSNLKRDVAVKVLPAELSADSERLARLEREAHLLASLNHPNIATIHSLEEEGGTRFLVLELVKGESLEQRLRKGTLETDQALELAKQIAEALEAAHGEGIIHRDLKPANVLITPDGRAKVLDFGVAKAIETGALATASQATNLTVAGTLVGTVPYMSPEQVRGEHFDKRADVWAFGCVVYEMLTGSHPFARETVADTLAAIIEVEPDWGRLPAATPDPVMSLLRRCLQKNPKLRLRDMGDAWVEMNAFLTDPARVSPAPASIGGPGDRAAAIPPWRSAAPWIIAVVAVVGIWLAALGAWHSIGARFATGLSGVRYAEIGLPAGQHLSGYFVISPDGRDLVYFGTQPSGERQLYHRPLDERDATPLEGTEDASDPFFSPDGEWVGFFQGADIKRVELSGGTPIAVCRGCVANAGGAAWLADGTIVFGSGGGLHQVPAAGGEARSFGQRDTAADLRYSRPAALPGSAAVLIQLDRLDPGNSDGIGVAVMFPDSEAVQIDTGGVGASPRYSPTGHVIYSREGALFAVPFDLELVQAAGQPGRVFDGVSPTDFSLSGDGTLVYVAGTELTGSRVNEVVSIDLHGGDTPLIRIDDSTRGPNVYWDVRLSPDHRYLALSAQPPGGGQRIWVHDIDRGTTDPVSPEGAVSRYPVWSRDGSRIAFSSDAVSGAIMWMDVGDPSGAQEQLTTVAPSRPGSFSPDGTVLAFRDDEAVRATGRDIVLQRMAGDATPVAFVATDGHEYTPRFSPDGKWLTYTSDETGDLEVYITPFPEYNRRRVSTDGGLSAVWAPDGRSIYYRADDNMMKVSFESATGALGDPEFLFERHFALVPNRAQYDIAPGGEGFVILTPPRPLDGPEGEATTLDAIRVVFNWFDILDKRVPTGR